MKDVTTIISDFGGPTAFARAIGVEPSTASEMKRRGSIPVRYWTSIIAAAKKLGLKIDSNDLMAAHSEATS